MSDCSIPDPPPAKDRLHLIFFLSDKILQADESFKMTDDL